MTLEVEPIPPGPSPAIQELGSVSFELDDEEIYALLSESRPAPVMHAADLAPSGELLAVTRRIATQYLEVLQVSAAGLFAGHDPRGSAAQLVTVLDALDRLAAAGNDAPQRELLAEIRRAADAFLADPRGQARNRFLARLRPWIVRYADHLGDDEGQRLRALVSFDMGEVPLFSELAAIPGIGPRRLDRLFCAGLYAVEVVSGSNPVEVAQVTGLPRALAEDVVARARDFAAERRRRCVVEIRNHLAEFSRILEGIDANTNPDLHALALGAFHEMHAVVTSHRTESTR
ncbi:MAG: hypothetical protein Q8P41_28890 [Pseudomonadota bacterium]|nr:hypothetical protein [Pseudomonadota bacterium]